MQTEWGGLIITSGAHTTPLRLSALSGENMNQLADSRKRNSKSENSKLKNRNSKIANHQSQITNRKSPITNDSVALRPMGTIPDAGGLG
jgi:hypothetical protein